MKYTEWVGYFEGWAQLKLRGQTSDSPGIIPRWTETREIRVMWEEGITDDTGEFVVREIAQWIRELCLGLEFTVVPYGTGWREAGRRVSVTDYIRPALLPSGVDYEQLFRLSYHEPYRRVHQHADVYIMKRPFHDDTVSWGCSIFEYGCLLLTLHGGRQNNRDFLRGVVRHELGHLFGMPIHCDHVGVEGWAYDSSCNMHYAVPSSRLCPKCRSLLHLWWQHIKAALR